MSDFLSAGAPAALRNASANFGPPEARYQSTSGGSYNYQWAEVAWFLKPSINPSTGQQDTTAADPTAPTATPVPLYTLYRRQRLAVPDNSLVTPALPATPANLAACLELSCWTDKDGNLYFNSPMDLTVPGRRFGGGKPTQFTTIATELRALGQSNPTLAGADIQLTDVVSFDVRVLAQGILILPNQPPPIDRFVTLYEPPFTRVTGGIIGLVSGYIYTNSLGLPPAAKAFDTWTSVHDSLNDYSLWYQSGHPTSMPLLASEMLLTPVILGRGPIIQALQISIRIWDAKTNQTRQVTIIQAM
jgi:hypothetical protein